VHRIFPDLFGIAVGAKMTTTAIAKRKLVYLFTVQFNEHDTRQAYFNQAERQ
jgi:hypothetical protein